MCHASQYAKEGEGAKNSTPTNKKWKPRRNKPSEYNEQQDGQNRKGNQLSVFEVGTYLLVDCDIYRTIAANHDMQRLRSNQRLNRFVVALLCGFIFCCELHHRKGLLTTPRKQACAA